ncbi:MAG: hypothetical protein V1725_03070 [archaeon]
MRLLSRKEGSVRLFVEDKDDVWQLSQLIEQGDHIRGKVERKVSLSDRTSEKARVERKIYTLSLQVEKVEWTDACARVIGVVLDGNDEVARGSHQGMQVEEGSTLDLAKESWAAYQEERLRESLAEKKNMLLVIFDREDALFVLLKKQGHIVLSKLKGSVAKKAMPTAAKNFYHDIKELLETYDARYTPTNIICASPAFWNEYLLKELPDALRKKAVGVNCSGVDEQSIPEILKSAALQRVLEHDTLTKELKLLAELMAGIAHDVAAYGLQATDEAITSGNARCVLVSEDLLKKYKLAGKHKDLERLLRRAEQMKGQVHIITNKDALQQLNKLGGVACLLRWQHS